MRTIGLLDMRTREAECVRCVKARDPNVDLDYDGRVIEKIPRKKFRCVQCGEVLK